jgi:hypothetical protein
VLLAAAIVLAVVLRIALNRDRGPAVALAGIWERVRPALVADVRAAPGPFVYLSIVARRFRAGVSPAASNRRADGAIAAQPPSVA